MLSKMQRCVSVNYKRTNIVTQTMFLCGQLFVTNITRLGPKKNNPGGASATYITLGNLKISTFGCSCRVMYYLEQHLFQAIFRDLSGEIVFEDPKLSSLAPSLATAFCTFGFHVVQTDHFVRMFVYESVNFARTRV